MNEPDDLALLRDYAANDSETAFEELVSRRVDFVYSAALRQTRNPNLAEEITQAVFIILAQKAGKISDKTILTGWLFKTTRFAALAQMRAESKRARQQKEFQMENEIQSAATDELWNQMSPLLDEALAALGETDRQAVLLRFFENKSLAEVGNFLGLGEDTARKRVARALEKLHRHFNKRGVSSTTAIIAGMVSANSIQAAPVGLTKIISTVAVAKGAAASSSTLTLIKGALKIMAWSNAKMAIGVGILLVAGVGIVAVKNNYFPSEPSYQGKMLSEWLVDIDYGQPQEKRTKAGKAIHQMGVKTLPFLLADLANKQTTNGNLYSQVTWAFDALGSTGKPAIPKLTKLLEQNPGYVPGALAGIGRDALPELLNALTNGSFWVRDNTAAYLANAISSGKITPGEASAAFPIAINNLAYDNTNILFRENTRWRAAGLVEALKLEPDISIPALLNCLQESMNETNYTIAATCALALGHFGSDAQPAIPSMIKSMEKLLEEPTDINHIACETQFAMALGYCGRKAQAAIPILIAASNSTNASLSLIAKQSLDLIQKTK